MKTYWVERIQHKASLHHMGIFVPMMPNVTKVKIIKSNQTKSRYNSKARTGIDIKPTKASTPTVADNFSIQRFIYAKNLVITGFKFNQIRIFT